MFILKRDRVTGAAVVEAAGPGITSLRLKDSVANGVQKESGGLRGHCRTHEDLLGQLFRRSESQC